MNSKFFLSLGFLLLLAIGAERVLVVSPVAEAERMGAAIAELREATPPQDPGTFPARWNAGNDCDAEPVFQVHDYNDDLYIIRQSKCAIYEAPFLYLIFGEDTALLMDTGSNPNTNLPGVVHNVIEHWLQLKGKDSVELIVAHTHTHADHTAGDEQMKAQHWVNTLVEKDEVSTLQFWGFQDYPNDAQTIDLGDRVLDVLGTPGHQAWSVTLYDRNTHLLLTGDIVYPGHLFVFSPAEWPDFIESLVRLSRFARTHPVEWVLGCHIEYSNTPGQPYAWGTQVHPDEHPLELHPTIITKILAAALSMGSEPECKIFDEFVIHPVYLCGITWNG